MIQSIARLFICGWIAFFTLSAQAQEEVSVDSVLDSVVITASRIDAARLVSPMSVTTTSLIQRQPFLSLTSLQEQVNEVPGLISFNSGNYAQDLRISIRGFGARSAFGIRGIKLIVDGIPETTPDGQGQLDNLSLQDISNIEVIRGGASSLYGNASGGVLDIHTIDPSDKLPITLGVRRGSFGTEQYQVRGGLSGDNWAGMLSVGHQHSDGYRQHSAYTQTNLLGKLALELSASSALKLQLSYMDSPLAQDPGGVNIASVEMDRSLARDRNISFDSGEEIKHWKAGLSYENKLDNTFDLSSYAFVSGRQFDGRLPFGDGGAIDLDRIYAGHGSQLEMKNIGTSSSNNLSVGYDIGLQTDDRIRFVNEDGVRGAETLNQEESFNSIGIFLLDHFAINDFRIHGGLRYDYNLLEIEDLFLIDGDDTGSQNYNSLNVNLGVSKKVNESDAIFISYSTSFETPTLSELTANPNGQGGFNNDLEPQEAKHYEIGWKHVNHASVSGEISIFRIDSEDETIPFELADFPGRTFFKNAGKTTRTGVELSSDINLGSNWSSRVVYGYSRILFSDFSSGGDVLDGNRVPGLPQHQGSLSINYKSQYIFSRFQINHLGNLFVDNANATLIEASTVSSLQIGGYIRTADLLIMPSLSVHNLFDVDYFDNLRSNAFGARYYEPAAGRFIQFGLTFQLNN